MKKLIKKWLGLTDADEVSRMIKSLEVTCGNLEKKATKYSKMLEVCEPYLKKVFDGGRYDEIMGGYESAHDSDMRYMAEYNIEHAAKRQKIKNFPSLKEKVVLHGGCLGCVTPIKSGIGTCQGCLYFNGVTSNYPNLKE